MSISLDVLVQSIDPKNTALFLGAGASAPSGGPTGAELAELLWRDVAHSAPKSRDLIETTSILERNFSRRGMVDVIVANLSRLKPTGGLLALPSLEWRSIYTTNFDRLMELAFRSIGKSLTVFRSNIDFSRSEIDPSATCLYKIHGCITQDRSLGNAASMILTERDYETYSHYRQILFNKFEGDLLSGNVLIIGQSLSDRHLRDAVNKACDIKDKSGAPGAIYALIYDADDLRAPLLEDRGVRIAFGSIDQAMHAFTTSKVFAPAPPSATDSGLLPIGLLASTLDVAVERDKSPNIRRMFNGGAATHADVRAGATFQRTSERAAKEAIISSDKVSATIVGAAGVGKSSLARRLLMDLSDNSYLCWEHKSEFPFDYKPWLRVDSTLRERGLKGVLLIDECTHSLRQANALVDHLANIPEPALKICMTANSALWSPRVKTPNVFSKGVVITLSRLDDPEIEALINLVDSNPDISGLVQSSFRTMGRSAKFNTLRMRCSADMFVCLKNIFDNESLDTILLREFNDLNDASQEYYRYVAALEAVGTRVHRQLIIRMLAIPPLQVAGILSNLEGIIDEEVVSVRDGIYAWATRHLVIARKITEYKFSSLDELTSLFERIIDNVVPTHPLELQTIRNICDTDFGIGGRIGDAVIRKKLYERLIAIAPGERIPWHRLIREALDTGSLDDVEHLIREAEEVVKSDAPIDRYKVRLLVARAEAVKGISEGDRIALLRKAYEQATNNLKRHQHDKFSYGTLCDVAIKLIERGEPPALLDEAIARMRTASEHILDPDLQRRLSYFEGVRARMAT